MRISNTFIIITGILIIGCSPKYSKVGTYSKNKNLNAVIEFSADTHKTTTYQELSANYKTGKNTIKDDNAAFLPYMGNYGFIAGTLTKPNEDGDGNPVDVFILSEHNRTGKIVEVIPLALLKLIDSGDLDYKVIAIPANNKQDAFKVASYNDLKKEYPGIIAAVETWFKEHDNITQQSIVGWGDEKEAIAYVNANLKQK